MRWPLRRSIQKSRVFRERLPGALWLPACVAALCFTFLGLGLGQGLAGREGLLAGEAPLNTRVNFNDGPVIEAHVVGINSGYLFYILEGETAATMSTFAENIQSLQAIEKD